MSSYLEQGVGNNSGERFLFTGRKPVIGMRLYAEIYKRAGFGNPFTMEGYLLEMEAIPAPAQLASSSSLLWRLVSNPAHGIHDTDEKARIITDHCGTLHGHRVRGLGWNAEHRSDGSGIMSVVFQFDDSLFFPWKITELRELTTAEVTELVSKTVQIPALNEKLQAAVGAS